MLELGERAWSVGRSFGTVLSMPSRASDESHDLELDLPPLDGAEDGDAEVQESLDFDLGADVDAFALDDATSEDEPIEFAVEGAESGWLDDAEAEEDLDVGAFDLATDDDADVRAESAEQADDEASGDADDWDDLALRVEGSVIDAGEEGPFDADDDLREEDLPELDADEEGDAVVDVGPDEATFGANDEIRWDDRAWEHLEGVPPRDDDAEDVDAHLLGQDPSSPRDATWRTLESTGRVTASVVVPGGAVVVAMNERTGVVLVRISNEGVARIIAEIEAENDQDDVHVSSLRWDASRTCVVAASSAGTHAFRPR